MAENTINELLDRFDETQADETVDQIIAWYIKQQSMKAAGIKPKRQDHEDIDVMAFMRAASDRLSATSPKPVTSGKMKRRI